jgi:hypothetical protein
MRRDVFIENDSGGFSVLAADAVDAIIDDGRSDDFRFVTERKVLLLELYGDDSMPVRIVADEPLRADEEAQWLARASWQIDTSDGRMLVMGGFDPDVLSWWKDAGGEGDARGVAALSTAPGKWRVDVYAHVGSMNGREILIEADERPGSAFRRSHPERSVPLWLAKMLEYSGEEDPGFEEVWRDIPASMAAGKLAVDTEGPDAIGFLVHFTRANGAPGTPPEGGWFERTHNGRVPATFPVGLASEAPDPELRNFRNRLLGIREPEPERPIADNVVEVIEVWGGEPLKPVQGGPVALPPTDAFLLHWMASLTADSAPRFEIWVEPKGAWTPPAPTPDFAVASKGKSVTSIGPVFNSGGWHVWWTSRSVAETLAAVPDGSTIDMGMAARLDYDSELDPAIGRALYSGKMSGGVWQITDASPHVSRDTLEQAIAFARDLAKNGRLEVRKGKEREAFDAEAAIYSSEEGSLVWEGDVVHLTDPDERTMIILGSTVFRIRFGGQWPVNVPESDDDDE